MVMPKATEEIILSYNFLQHFGEAITCSEKTATCFTKLQTDHLQCKMMITTQIKETDNPDIFDTEAKHTVINSEVLIQSRKLSEPLTEYKPNKICETANNAANTERYILLLPNWPPENTVREETNQAHRGTSISATAARAAKNSMNAHPRAVAYDVRRGNEQLILSDILGNKTLVPATVGPSSPHTVLFITLT
uniref:Uncharacterized protein n=1 Tax=Glossina pallidipes TaxID=7398 RepID=A0A1B0AEF4_GLOPL